MFKSRHFYIPLVLIGIFCMPIMLADVLYRDDLDRSLFSFDGWGVLGRPLSDFLMHIFSLNFDMLPNTAPLPLITGVVITSVIIWYTSESLTEDKNKTVFSLFLTLIIATPFFIQNAAYQFDSFTMILATSLCILSFFTFNNKSIVSCLLSIAFLIASLCLYQPCANIFITLVAGNAIYKYAKISNINSLAVFLLSYLLYFILVNYAFEMTSARASYVPIVDIYQSFINSIKKVYFYFSLIGKLYEYIVLIGVVCFMYCYFKALLKAKGSGCVDTLFITLSPAAILISLPGPAFLLSEGITDVRVLSGLSATTALFLYSYYKALNKITFILLSSVVIFFSISTSFLFSNTIKEQRKYEEFVVSLVAGDLSKMEFSGKVYAYGDIYDSRIVGKILASNKFIEQIYSPAIPWISISIMQQYNIKNIALYGETQAYNKMNEVCDNKISPTIKSRYYSIFKLEYDVVVYYGAGECEAR